VKHVFHAENPTVLSESLSIGRWPPKWVEGRRIKLTFSDVVRQNSLVLPVGVTDARNQLAAFRGRRHDARSLQCPDAPDSTPNAPTRCTVAAQEQNHG